MVVTQKFFLKIDQHESDVNLFQAQSLVETIDVDWSDPFGNSGTQTSGITAKAYPTGMPRNLKNGDTFTLTSNTDMQGFVTNLRDTDHLPSRQWYRLPFPTGSIEFNTGDIIRFTFGDEPKGFWGPPTYLEELHKLDNYTRAQYIPDRR